MVGVNIVALHYNPVRVRRAQDDQLGFRLIQHLAGARRTELHFREVAPALPLFQQTALGCCAASSAPTCAGRHQGRLYFAESGNRQASSRIVNMKSKTAASETIPAAIPVEEIAAVMKITPYKLRLVIGRAAAETLQVREGVHALFLIAERGTTRELYRAMSIAFATPRKS